MRVIGGIARGRALIAPEGQDTRPTSDRTREALFNILQRQVPGARVLDLFSGSGALSAEALSRMAQEVVCVDLSPKACAVIRKNCDIKGIEGKATVIQADWRAALSCCTQPFDIVFVDPPYAMTDVYAQVFYELVQHNLLAPEGIIVMEHDSATPIPLPETAEVVDSRRYGKAGILFVRKMEANA